MYVDMQISILTHKYITVLHKINNPKEHTQPHMYKQIGIRPGTKRHSCPLLTWMEPPLIKESWAIKSRLLLTELSQCVQSRMQLNSQDWCGGYEMYILRVMQISCILIEMLITQLHLLVI